MATMLTIVLDGLAYSMVLFIVSIGLAITMGIMRVVNVAHGAFAMIGGYVGLIVLDHDLPFLFAAMSAATVAGLIGLVVEILLYRKIYYKGELSQLLLTFGLVFVLVSMMTFLSGVDVKPMYLPRSLSGVMDFGFGTYPSFRLMVIGIGLFLAFAIWLVIKKTSYGIRLRAAVENPLMASGLGINTQFLLTVTFTAGCALAGLGGLLGAEVLLIEPFYALRYLVLFLIVVSIGGHGSFLGSFVAALAIGMVSTIGSFLFDNYSAYIMYGLVFVLLLCRPHGLLAKRI